jgi:hypothetical protein
MPKGPKRKPPIERFSKFVRCACNGCWLWIGHRFPNGYGSFSPGGREHSIYAHRFSYQHYIGPIPEGREVAHACGNPSCVNPDHLRAMTHRENLFDTFTSARRNAEKRHCKHGHEFTPENTIRLRNGWRQCRECKRLSLRAWYKANRERIIAERRAKRIARQPPMKKTHCKHGHPFNEQNTRFDRRGHRVCKTCQRLAMRRYRHNAVLARAGRGNN